MENLELLRRDLIREYKQRQQIIENAKLHIQLKLENLCVKKTPKKKENIVSIKQCRNIIQRNEKKLIDIRRKYFKYFGNLEEIFSLESRDNTNKKLIIRLDI